MPATVAPGELRALAGHRVAVIGVREVGDYDAASTAQALKELHNIEAFAEEVSIPDLPVAASLTDLYGRRAPVPKTRAGSIAYPPGFTNLPDGGFELLSSPPSPHGWRLQQAIALGVVRARCTELQADGAGSSPPKTGDKAFRGDAFVLATGQHIGGGLSQGGATREPLLEAWGLLRGQAGLDLGHAAAAPRVRRSGAASFASGSTTDNDCIRWTKGVGRRIDNLFAAGAVLGGYDYAGPCGFGVPDPHRLAGRALAARFGR